MDFSERIVGMLSNLSEQEFYNVLGAVRGPDMSYTVEGEEFKYGTTSRIRYLLFGGDGLQQNADMMYTKYGAFYNPIVMTLEEADKLARLKSAVPNHYVHHIEEAISVLRDDPIFGGPEVVKVLLGED